MHQAFGYMSLVVATISLCVYLTSIFQGRTKPHIFSWGMYTVITSFIFWVQYSSGSGAGSWATGFTALSCLFVALLCMKYGTKDITQSDQLALLAAIPAVIAWSVSDSPFWALCFIIAAETLGFYGTVRKSWYRPHEEPMLAYALSSLKLAFTILAAEAHNFYTLAYPIYYVALYSMFISMVLWRRTLIKRRSLAEQPLDNTPFSV